MFSEPEPFGTHLTSSPSQSGHEVPVDDRHAIADVRAGVLARQRVHGVRAQRVLDGRALGAVVERLVDPRWMQGEALADAAVVDGDARVLADEVRAFFGDLDVLQDRVEHLLACRVRLARGRAGQRVAKILRDVLERPDVEMRGRVLDDLLKIRRDRHAALAAAARPARRPKTQHSRSELPIIRFRPCVPPAISPHANSPSTVVSASSEITRPPFW